MGSSKWYAIEAKAGERAAVYLYDEIGLQGVSAKQFAEEFNAINADFIDLYVESFGGSVIEGTAIKSVIANHPAYVTAHIDSIAGSITSSIILACDEIYIADDAYVMIHNPSLSSDGDADEHRKDAEILDKMTAAMAEGYAKRMGISDEEAKSIMKAETWYRGQEAVDAGYADKTYSGRQMVAHFDPQRFTAKAPAEAVERFTKSPPSGKTKSEQKGQTMSDAPIATEEETTVVINEAPEVTPEVVADEPVETVAEAVAIALKDERVRIVGINALGNKFGFNADAETFVASGGTVADFRAHVLNKSPEDWKASLAVRNPAQQATDEGEQDKSGNDAVAQIKERRKARHSG